VSTPGTSGTKSPYGHPLKVPDHVRLAARDRHGHRLTLGGPKFDDTKVMMRFFRIIAPNAP
jgi:hypothetical protein